VIDECTLGDSEAAQKRLDFVIKKMDFLLSWNCSHLGVEANIKIRDYNEKHRLWTPLLVTPEALMDYTMEVL
jgi:hypothetical protein